MLTRRDVLKFGVATGLMLGVASFAGKTFAQAMDALAFNPDAYTELTETISTATGDREVRYRFWKALPYVANPVDVAYQSLNISQPIAIDGVAVDATDAPIVFANSVGGYMPSSVAEAEGVDGAGMTGMPGGAPDGDAPGSEVATGGNAMLNGGERVSLSKLALAAGYVAVEPGARGRTLQDASGNYYGVAPAAIVDLKAAVRYLKHNRGLVPGNTDWIVSTGTSAGGALSALLGASGDSALFSTALAEAGAADASDAIFASGDWCPITDLEHADMAYEWNWGGNPLASGETLDTAVSTDLATAFADYQASIGLIGRDGFGPLTAATYGDYMVQTYLAPAAETYLAALSEEDRAAYLADNAFITYADGKASFTWADFLTHVGARKKSAPAFDTFDLSSGENNLFGLGTTEARHFTPYGLQKASGDATAVLDADIPEKLRQMNPMGFIAEANPGRARHWWIRVGTKDSDTSLTVVGNLAAALENLGDDVNARMYWDAGHGSNEDPADFIAWVAEITGHRA
jgi:acetyl esterase/lipase